VDVFLSYASEDRPTADAVAVGLRQDGHEVFFDRDDLPPGEGFHTAIREAVDRSELFVFLVSPDSVEVSSYAMTELALAREKWRDPSGRILPVIARQTPMGEIPAYLRAVTLLEARGDLVAEVLARVANIAGRRRRKRLVRVAAGLGVLAALAGTAVWWFEPAPPPAPCYLKAELRNTGSGTPIPSGVVLDVSHDGSTSSFLVSGDGLSAIHVGPLVPPALTWTIQLKTADGVVLGQQTLEGCVDSPKTVPVGRDLELVLSPR